MKETQLAKMKTDQGLIVAQSAEEFDATLSSSIEGVYEASIT